MPVTLTCPICQRSFRVPPCRAIPGSPNLAKYCGRACADKGQRRTPWAKGKTKETDPQVAQAAERMRQFYASHPGHRSGEKHHMFGKPMLPTTMEKLRAANKGKPATPTQQECLKKGQQHFKGKTAQTDPVTAERAKKSGDSRRGKPNPAHAERMKRYYVANPEKHPNHVLCKHGHETGIERAMREALNAVGIAFKAQYHLGSLWIDFAIPKSRLAVEVDGSYWHDPAKDAARDALIEGMGWRVIHFTDRQVNRHLGKCIETVKGLL